MQFRLLPLLSLVSGLIWSHFAYGDIRLDPGVPIFLPGGAPESVRLAVADLQRDLEKVLGRPSPVLLDEKEITGRPAIVILWNSDIRADLHDPQVVGREAHGIHQRRVGGQGCLILEGSDARGAIYAIYSFSDEFLDIPPLWYWAEWVPTKRDSIRISDGTHRIFPPAYVRWRAWLNNDTDFLSPWRARSAQNDQAMYETILRLKYNTYEVGSLVDLRPTAPRYAINAEVTKANERGLVITHHHTSPLGSNLGSWDAFWRHEGREPPPLSVRDPENLKTFWRYHIEAAKRAGLEQVPTLVFRGSRDIPFWETFKDAPSDPTARAQMIGDMLNAQATVVKEVTGETAPFMRTTLYNEGTTFFAAGLLHLPEDPTVIYNFVAARRDHFPGPEVRNYRAPPGRLLGYYLNFQFTSTGSHLAAAEGPWKMAANYRIVDAVGTEPLAFTVVNAGNNREHLTELSANAAMMWRFKEFDADAFLRNFCARYYGAAQADTAAALYRDYYQAYWRQKPADIPGFDRQYIFQDERYARALEMLLKDMAANLNRPDPLAGNPLDNADTGSVGYFRVAPLAGETGPFGALLRGTAESQKRFEAVAVRADALQTQAGQGGTYFNDNLRQRARLMAALNQALHETVLAYQAQSVRDEKRKHLEKALGATDVVLSALNATNHGNFDRWYASDRNFGLEPIRARLKAELAR